MLNTVLVALDGSKLAEQALPAAAGVASQAGAEVVLVTAIGVGERWGDQSLSRAWEGQEQAAAQHYLDATAARLRDSGVKVRTRSAWGQPVEVIGTLADAEGADLIAMTTHGRSGLVRAVMGSVADRVVHTSRKPVLLLRAREEAGTETFRVAKILVPLDGSPLAESVLPFVGNLALRMGAALVLERVIMPATALYAGEYLPSGLPVLDELEKAARGYLESVADRQRARGLDVTVEIDVGYPAEAILDGAQRNGAGLIALCTHGRSGPERWVMGSVADDIVRHSQLPGLVLPARAAGTDADEGPPIQTWTGIAPAPVVVPPPALQEVEQQGKPGRRPAEKRPFRPEGPGRGYR